MMKTFGFPGGMSWESTVLYYRIIDRVGLSGTRFTMEEDFCR